MKLAFALFLVLSFQRASLAADQPSATQIIRSNYCVLRTTECQYVNWSWPSSRNEPAWCEMRYSYLLRNQAVIVNTRTGERRTELEDNAHFKTFERQWYTNYQATEEGWENSCLSYCRAALQAIVSLYGRCP